MSRRRPYNICCPVCRRSVGAGITVWRHYDHAGNACPMSGQPRPEITPDKKLRPAELLDEFEWLIGGGTPATEAARRLGKTVAAIHKAYKRAGLEAPLPLRLDLGRASA